MGQRWDHRSPYHLSTLDEELPNKEAPVESIAEEATDYGQDEKLSSKENDIDVEVLIAKTRDKEN